MEKILRLARKIIPKKIFKALQPVYHWLMAFLAAVIYRFPSRKIFVIGVTGTKGKTSTIEIISAILEEARFKTSLTSSLHFKVGRESWKNEYKMTMPGRFFLQKFLRRAVKEKCQYAVLEMTSEGAVQHRNKFIKTNALIFTNLAPEHIESHGSFEAYRDAKLRYFRDLEKSREKRRLAVVNEDDSAAPYFLKFDIPQKIKYGLKDVSNYNLQKDGLSFILDNIEIKSKLSGLFNLYNILAAVAFCKTQNIGNETIKKAIEKFQGIEGRLEKIDEGQNFSVIVDYAHTPDSLEKVYETFQTSRKVCVLGSAGGGRDKWKRPEMGKIASKHCDQIILTNEDPYDEDPNQILLDIKSGISNDQFPNSNFEIILGRHEAIAKALSYAQTGDAVIITGKGSEPWLMGPKGTKIKWDDRETAREELRKILSTK
ncbi:MAG: UDP-N-acetylmuramoyl-L-alanyl-D-glutamate--2,6-diaminopimelate ligase [Candidatus Terrybacteria bacterium]|nr:UDP-N-acetylmuramoyl-L-alanyl-D-glutamate--2,6-diaminopimelate ligase [Candidatus Terrybacteria bacterium]